MKNIISYKEKKYSIQQLRILLQNFKRNSNKGVLIDSPVADVALGSERHNFKQIFISLDLAFEIK